MELDVVAGVQEFLAEGLVHVEVVVEVAAHDGLRANCEILCILDTAPHIVAREGMWRVTQGELAVGQQYDER